MGPEKLPEAILNILQFDAFLVALLFGALGFSFGRLWPEGERAPSLSLRSLWLVPGFLLACACLYLVANDYIGLTRAISRKETLTYATEWMDQYWHFFWLLAAAAFSIGLGTTLVRKGGSVDAKSNCADATSSSSNPL